MGKLSLSYFGPVVWETMLPEEFKKISTLDKFKDSIKKWIPNCNCRLCKERVVLNWSPRYTRFRIITALDLVGIHFTFWLFLLCTVYLEAVSRLKRRSAKTLSLKSLLLPWKIIMFSFRNRLSRKSCNLRHYKWTLSHSWIFSIPRKFTLVSNLYLGKSG